jgi:ElaB/YqjD/DUF883 family membrane-anchored ribosome-binding protein
MAGSPTTEEVVKLRVAVAKARLRATAAAIDERPGMATRAVVAIRTHPWQGIGIALAAGIVLGLGRGLLPALAPVAGGLLANVAGSATRRLGRRP